MALLYRKANPKINDYICKDEIVFETSNRTEDRGCLKNQKLTLVLWFLNINMTATQMPLKYSVTSLKDFEYSEEFYIFKNSYLTGQESIERGIFITRFFSL